MPRRASIVACLVFSGFAALVYQIIWTRLLGLAFGTTTESIATVLGVFFGGMALGNLVAARRLARVARPLRVYALLELAIGLFALVSLPLLRGLDVYYAALAAQHGAGAAAALRLLAAALILLPPTMAMGATLPVVARGLVVEDGALGRWSALLYAANTFGAVVGAYLCGFWLLPRLGVGHSVTLAATVNLGVALFVLAAAGRARLTAATEAVRTATGSASATAGARATFLIFFGVSGFVAIGYEIVWSKVFGIVMEGTIYGFSAVLTAYLLGITLGSLAFAPRVDRIRNLPRAFALLHLAIAASVAAGMGAIPYLPFVLRRLAGMSGGGDAVHLLFALVAPIVLLPTALFGAAFPVLIRIYTHRAERVGEGVGVATAVNTAGSILASLAVGFWMIPSLGMDATLYLLLLLDLSIAIVIVLAFEQGTLRERTASAGLAAAVLLGVALFFSGVGAEKAIAGRTLRPSSLAEYVDQLDRAEGARTFLSEGRTSIVTVHRTGLARTLQNNGLPEAGVMLGPPYLAREAVLLGVLPYLVADQPTRALVIGLGGANTVDALARTQLASIDAVEIEPGVVEAAHVLYAGRQSPLDDPRVHVRIGDGRHDLLLGRRPGGPRYDVIASQPSHPWVAGAANLFTEEFFALAREGLAEGGVFALWVNGFRTDPESVLALLGSFERVFPGALLVDAGWARPRDSLLLLGARAPIRVDLDRLAARLAEPRLRELLGLFRLDRPERILALCEGPARVFAALAPGASNTDDNAFVETRIPRRLEWSTLDFEVLERRISADAPVLPPVAGVLDVAAVARGLIDNADGRPGAAPERVWPYTARLERLLRVSGAQIDETTREVLRAEADARGTSHEADAVSRLRALADAAPDRPEPLRALGLHLALRRQDFAGAAAAFASAFERSGDPQDAYDAGRALHHVDRARSFAWFDEIPAAARPRFPRLAVYDAERALAEGVRGPALQPFYAALLQHRDTPQGRVLPEIPDLLARLADAAGDEDAARLWNDVSFQQRLTRGSAALGRARTALEAGDLGAVMEPLAEAQRALPADSRVLELRARLARAQGDAAGLERALVALRELAPSLEMAIVSENRFRTELGLPLLPPRAPADLFARRP